MTQYYAHLSQSSSSATMLELMPKGKQEEPLLLDKKSSAQYSSPLDTSKVVDVVQSQTSVDFKVNW